MCGFHPPKTKKLMTLFISSDKQNLRISWIPHLPSTLLFFFSPSWFSCFVWTHFFIDSLEGLKAFVCYKVFFTWIDWLDIKLFLLECSGLCFICLLTSVNRGEEQQVLCSLRISLYVTSFEACKIPFFLLLPNFTLMCPGLDILCLFFWTLFDPFGLKNSYSSVLGKVFEWFLWFFFFLHFLPSFSFIWFLKLLH